jgi:hypothetical protein
LHPSSGTLATSEVDLGALLWAAIWSLANTPLVMASSASNMGTWSLCMQVLIICSSRRFPLSPQVMASSASNIGTLLFTLHGLRGAPRGGGGGERSAWRSGLPLLIDTEASSPYSSPRRPNRGPARPRPRTNGTLGLGIDLEDVRGQLELGLEHGKYFCRLDWGMRRFGLCTAGELGSRPGKPW